MSGIVSTANKTIASIGKPTDRKTEVIGAKYDAPLGNPIPPILISTDIKPTVAMCEGRVQRHRAERQRKTQRSARSAC